MSLGTSVTLRLSAARTAGATRGVGSGRRGGQLQAQLYRLHLQGLMRGGPRAAAEGRPARRKGESQEKTVDSGDATVT